MNTFEKQQRKYYWMRIYYRVWGHRWTRMKEWYCIQFGHNYAEDGDCTRCWECQEGYERMAGLHALTEFEDELRKVDLAQIGYIILSDIGEANHGGWDGFDRETLVAINRGFEVMIESFKYNHKYPDHYTDHDGWGFGGKEHWDSQGVRHERV